MNKQVILRVLSSFCGLAATVSTLSANTTCAWYVHQPVMPDEVRRLKKR
ncbi:cyclic lactone autoinducer peptide [Metaclostridioides mangenotii]|jgi:cyclic lactone autoinducer peptide|nr:cyclic lactone autoinducer peptide [Clostridioides mangenotii]